MQVKGNQKKLLEKCKQIGKYHDSIEKNKNFDSQRNRQETRIAEVYEIPVYLWEKIGIEWKPYVKVLVKITRITNIFDTKSKMTNERREESFYISTKKLSAKKFNKIIRSHWKIENSNHYVRDVTLKEDASRIRKNPQNFAKIRSF